LVDLTRRDWLRVTGQATLAAAATAHRATAAQGNDDRQPRTDHPSEFCLFSKPLPELGWRDLGRSVKEAGFDGVDLTVRPNGHVLPERAADDLPRAIDSIKASGLTVPMITTDITSADAPHARRLLETAARHGVRYFKTGYWQFASTDVRSDIAAAASALAKLAAVARDCGIEMGFHNHAAYIGAALWDIAPAIDPLEPRWAGYYFDPRHAVAEGGAGAWKAAAHLVAPRLKMVAVKDCVWQKTARGWATENCPLGEGLVDWAWVGSLLRDARFSGPISIHIEYEVPSATPADRTAGTLEAARRDLAYARRFLA
jgi:sugar phosphate isomerase/epimerase